MIPRVFQFAFGGARVRAFGVRIIRFILLELLGLFKIVRSAVLPPCCRFYPSCTEYADQTLRAYHPVTAIPLIIGRLLRCHPFHPGGIDLVNPPAPNA